jgi:hypothetical protein
MHLAANVGIEPRECAGFRRGTTRKRRQPRNKYVSRRRSWITTRIYTAVKVAFGDERLSRGHEYSISSTCATGAVCDAVPDSNDCSIATAKYERE